jgi:hypothetical protein
MSLKDGQQMQNNYDFENELCEECNENEAIVEIFIDEYSFLLCGSCRADLLKRASNE